MEKVTPGSPAEKAGVQAGDLILAIDGEELSDLRAYSNVLRSHAPGDRIRLKVRRGESEIDLEAVLVAR